jgi:hypothetical protein
MPGAVGCRSLTLIVHKKYACNRKKHLVVEHDWEYNWPVIRKDGAAGKNIIMYNKKAQHKKRVQY